ncbi:MAG: hypothetical protein ACO26U_01610 [Burkholderiaceae bacterium]
MSTDTPLKVLHVRIRAPQPWMASAPVLEAALSAWPHGVCMGVFMGLFGLDNHELLVMLSLRDEQHKRDNQAKSDPSQDPSQDLSREALTSLTHLLPPGFEVTQWQSMQATVRPDTDAPFDRAGVYVFRWFFMPQAHIDEAVALSAAGWETFERQDDLDAGGGYRTEPMGLFALRPGQQPGMVAGTHLSTPAGAPQGAGALLLVTWYDSMTSWERSRTPDPRATANFRRRAALTTSIVAYATRLARTA